MLSGNFSGSAAESKGISGTDTWATAGIPETSVAASRICKKRLMTSLLIQFLSRGRGFGRRLRLQDNFLYSPGFDFRHDDLVRVSAVQHVNDLEPARLFAGMAELADDRPR